MTQTHTQSRNQMRKRAYRAMGSEQGSHEARNAALDAAISAGMVNASAVGEARRAEVIDDDGQKRSVTTHLPADIIRPDLPPAPGSRSAKRARLKAARKKRINHVARELHRHGVVRCGNIGCASCRPGRYGNAP